MSNMRTLSILAGIAAASGGLPKRIEKPLFGHLPTRKARAARRRARTSQQRNRR